jgi:hypothetical protein
MADVAEKKTRALDSYFCSEHSSVERVHTAAVRDWSGHIEAAGTAAAG